MNVLLWQVFGISDFFTNEWLLWILTNVSCTYNYYASMQNCICCVKHINILSIYLSIYTFYWKGCGSNRHSTLSGVPFGQRSCPWKNLQGSLVPAVFQKIQPYPGQSWALSVFLNFFNNKRWFFCIFCKVNNLFLHQSYLKSPLPVKLTRYKMQKIIFYYWKNSKIPQVPSSDPGRSLEMIFIGQWDLF